MKTIFPNFVMVCSFSPPRTAKKVEDEIMMQDGISVKQYNSPDYLNAI